MSAMETEYGRRLAAARAQFARVYARGERFMLGAVAAGVAALGLLRVALRAGGGWVAFATMVVAAMGLVVLWLRARSEGLRQARLASLYERALARVRGEEVNSGATGEAFVAEGHVYAHDLNVVGRDSLFDRLATTRTGVGQRGLAGLLLAPVKAVVARARQAAVRELAGEVDLRESVAMLGRSQFEDVPPERFEQWLELGRSGFARWTHGALLATSAAWVALVVVGLVRGMSLPVLWQNLALLALAQGAICWRIRSRVKEELEAAEKLLGQTAVLRDGLRVLRAQRFTAARLQELQRDAEGEDLALARLERQLSVVEQRPKEWFYVVSLAFALGTHAAVSLDAWKREFDQPMRRWLAAWGEFEALVALGTYAAEHEESCWPEILDDGDAVATFAAERLRHPLLAPGAAVANDVALGSEVQFLLVSGSNMAGKSTLLRAMGASAVMALAGAPVAAKKMRMSALRVGASIAIVDALSEGKSKFLAEVERLKAMVELARSARGGMLFLIDEILSGTNSADRRVAAESVLRSLVEAGAVGAISTHDLALAAIAEEPGLRGLNVHMASADEADPLAFDYLLKPGVNRTTNALAIVRMLGL